MSKKEERCAIRGAGLHWGKREFHWMFETDEGPGGLALCDGHEAIFDSDKRYVPPPPGAVDARTDEEEEATP